MQPQDIEQRTDAWHQQRLGKATASKIADIMARTKSGFSTSRANYAAQLITERLTGTVAESFTSAAMNWGNDTEPQARSMYSFLFNEQVEETGFHNHPKIAMSGASPDGLVGSDGLIEIKCPNSATHIETLRGGSIADKYIKQMMWQMACTGRLWCDFASFDPRMPEPMQLFVQRVERDGAMISAMETEVATFLGEVDDAVRELESKYLPYPILAAG